MYIVVYCYNDDIQRLPEDYEEYCTAFKSMVEDMISTVKEDENINEEDANRVEQELIRFIKDGQDYHYTEVKSYGITYASIQLSKDSGSVFCFDDYHCYWKVMRV